MANKWKNTTQLDLCIWKIWGKYSTNTLKIHMQQLKKCFVNLGQKVQYGLE